MSRPGSWWTGHTHLAGLCATMATVLCWQAGPKPPGPRGCGPANLQPCSSTDDSATAPWSGVGVWHKTSSMLWVGSFRAVLWRAPCPGQQGSERGLRIKGHEPSWGYICRGGVWRSPQIEAHLICRGVPFGRFWGTCLPLESSFSWSQDLGELPTQQPAKILST